MFRNGITAGRRQLRPSISAVAPSAARCPTTVNTSAAAARHNAPFVCISCQSQAHFSSLNGGNSKKKTLNERAVDQLKNLEKHVQAMERAYVDAVRKRAETARLPKGEITEDMKDRAYAALMAPPMEDSINLLQLPGPRTILQRLPKEITSRLGTSTALVTGARPQWEPVLSVIEEKGGFSDMSVGSVNSLLRYMDVEQRADLVPRVWRMMAVAEIEPDSLTYDLAMMAYSQEQHRAESVEALFGEMIERGIRPTKYSYAHLLKAYSKKADLVAAAQAFKDMQAANIEPDLVVYTTLIQTALKCREYTVAWEIFNLIKLKSMATHPDEMTYNLMIHACAETGETERALNLWKEMTLRRGIEPGEETYHTIIHACALRKDYYHEAWKYATDMVKRGMRLNVYSVNILIQACGRVGELTRARLLVRHMINSGLETLQPNHITFQNMLRAYATYHVPGNRIKNKLLGSGTRDEINPLDAVFVQPTTNLQKHEPGEENLSMQIMEDIPFLPKAVLKTRRDVLDEAALLVNWLRDHFPEMVDTQMMNSYLDVCAAQGSIGDLKWSYFNDFENPPTHEELREQQRAEREAAEREQSEWPSQQYPHPEEDAPLYSDASEGAESQPANWGAVPEQAEADEAEPAAIEAEAEVSESETTDTEIPHSAVENDVAPSVASEPCESRSMATESEPESESEVATTSPASELSEFDPSTSELPDPTSFDDLPDPSTTNFDPSESESESHLPHESDQSDSNPTSQQTLLPPLSEETPADDEDVPIDGFSDLPKLHRNLYTFDSCLSACVTFRNLRFARKVWADRMKYLETPQYLSTRESDRRALDFAAERKLIDILALSDKTIEARERMLTLQNEAGVEWQWDELRTLYVKAVQLEDAVTVRAVRQATERDKEGRRKKWLDVTEEEAETPDYRY